MSIVNDALKKAGKEFEPKDQDTLIPAVNKAAPCPQKKWAAIVVAPLVILTVVFGIIILHKNMSGANLSNESRESSSAIQSTLNNIEQKTVARIIKSQDIVKLNGIFYDNTGRWAIVNNRIVKEGDSLLGGEITSIARDLVKIEKKDGSEIVLSLK